MDVTNYLPTYKLNAHDLAMKIILDVLATTGITATAGIGPNLFLAKVAMDVTAKHIPADRNGVRIAELDELSFRKTMWTHQPITDFWRVGPGYAAKLERYGMRTLGDVARCSVRDEELLYGLFGKNAELLIDHAWGWEPTTIKDIKAYKPSAKSLGSGQVLQCPYTCDKARLVVREMADLLVLDLVEKGLVCNQIVLTVGYDIENLSDLKKKYLGPTTQDRYGRLIPKHAHGTANLERYSSSSKRILQAVTELYDRIVDPSLLIRRLNVVANNVVLESEAPGAGEEQLDLFRDAEAERKEREREKQLQQAVISLRQKFGKNAVLKGMNLQEGATAKQRNSQIGGHRA